MELLTGPSLLILDEPTSGLDPAPRPPGDEDSAPARQCRPGGDGGDALAQLPVDVRSGSTARPAVRPAYCGSPAKSNVIAAMEPTMGRDLRVRRVLPDVAASRYESGRIPTPRTPGQGAAVPPIRAPQTSMVRQIAPSAADRSGLDLRRPRISGVPRCAAARCSGCSPWSYRRQGPDLNNADNPGEAVPDRGPGPVRAMFMVRR